MKQRTKFLIAWAVLGLVILAAALLTTEAQALNDKPWVELCMCAPRPGPAPPPPPPSPPGPGPSPPNPNPDDPDPPNPPDPPDPPCSPRYHGPSISLSNYTPNYPLVIGQDPDELGVDVTLRARGGSKSNGCNRGAGRATITSFSLNGVTLSDKAIARIQGELARAYPDAQVLGSYPLHPGTTYGGNGASTTLSFHFDPLDPGDYDITVTARQSDGKQTTRTFQVPVHLLETTIGW